MWKQLDDFPNYEISDKGEVRNIKRQRLLKPQRCNKYQVIQLGRGNQFYIHHLVMLAFVGPAEGRCVRHLDGDGSNNRLSNLVYGTMKENSNDRQQHGTWGWKLTENKVRLIRHGYAMGFTLKRLAEIFTVSTKHIRELVRLQRWKHVV